jgi:hypothetical protein
MLQAMAFIRSKTAVIIYVLGGASMEPPASTTTLPMFKPVEE